MSSVYKEGDVIHTKERKAFRVVALLGIGGMSEVYHANDHSMSREVVVKMLSPHALKHAERFVQEARMLANVSHPNVVRVHERGETKDPQCPYYTMEHLEAWSLREILVSRAKEQKYGLKWSVAVNVMSELLYGLGALHEAGIVHRDIKPENVVYAKVHGRNIVKIIDPGIAKLLDDDRLEGLVATPMYAAPEQLTDATRHPTPKTDVFAAGLLFYELLTGRYAYSVYGNDLAGAIERMNKPVFGPSLIRSDLPPALDKLVALMTALDPNDRPDATQAMHMFDEVGQAWDGVERLKRGEKAMSITDSPLLDRRAARREVRITRADLEAPTDPDGENISPNHRYMQMLAEQAVSLGYDPIAFVREHTKGVSPDELDQRYLLGMQDTSPTSAGQLAVGAAPTNGASTNGASPVIPVRYVVNTDATSQAKVPAERSAQSAVDRTSPTRSIKPGVVQNATTPMMTPESHTRARMGGKGGTKPMAPGFRAEDYPPERPFPAPPAASANGVVMGPVTTQPSQADARSASSRAVPVVGDKAVLETYAPSVVDEVPSRRAITPAAGRTATTPTRHRIAGAPVSPRKPNATSPVVIPMNQFPLWPFLVLGGVSFIVLVVGIAYAATHWGRL